MVFGRLIALDRTIISWNLPNLITVPLMAAIAFLIVGLAWQLWQRQTGKAPANNSGGY